MRENIRRRLLVLRIFGAGERAVCCGDVRFRSSLVARGIVEPNRKRDGAEKRATRAEAAKERWVGGGSLAGNPGESGCKGCVRSAVGTQSGGARGGRSRATGRENKVPRTCAAAKSLVAPSLGGSASILETAFLTPLVDENRPWVDNASKKYIGWYIVLLVIQPLLQVPQCPPQLVGF